MHYKHILTVDFCLHLKSRTMRLVARAPSPLYFRIRRQEIPRAPDSQPAAQSQTLKRSVLIRVIQIRHCMQQTHVLSYNFLARGRASCCSLANAFSMAANRAELRPLACSPTDLPTLLSYRIRAVDTTGTAEAIVIRPSFALSMPLFHSRRGYSEAYKSIPAMTSSSWQRATCVGSPSAANSPGMAPTAPQYSSQYAQCDSFPLSVEASVASA